MRPTAQQFADAVGKLGAIPMFPSDAHARQAIMEALAAMVSNIEQLRWLVGTMLNYSDQWHGVKELRGVFCTRFKPTDGIEGTCVHTRGFTPADCESDYLMSQPRQLSDSEAKKRLSEFGDAKLKQIESKPDGKTN